MATGTIKTESFDFLKKIAKNNDREWFAANKDLYAAAHENIIDFAGALLGEMNKHDQIETASGKQSLYRIYKDVRFSKEKVPYNDYWSGSFRRATKKLRGGYYFHLQPGGSFIAGGFWGPNTEDMQRLRQDMDANPQEWRKLFADKKLVATFGGVTGERLLTAPRGYSVDNPAIEQLRYKQFILKHTFTDDEVLSHDFAKNASDHFKKMRPFLNFMSDVLTTDANGISLVD